MTTRAQFVRESVEPATVAALQRPVPPGAQAAVPGKASAPLDILVAEDNEVNQLVFAQILSGLGLSYRIAGNGRIAGWQRRSR